MVGGEKLCSHSNDGWQRVGFDRGEVDVGVNVFVNFADGDDRVASDNVKTEGDQLHT